MKKTHDAAAIIMEGVWRKPRFGYFFGIPRVAGRYRGATLSRRL
jgi:hypothetical protein